jgi:ABC-type phosphate/phosphonate transport system permease subunit
MYRPESSETENPRKERNRNYREWLEAIAVMYILVVSSFWFG